MSQKTESGQIYHNVVSFFDLHELQLTQRIVFVGAKVFYGWDAFAYPNHSS